MDPDGHERVIGAPVAAMMLIGATQSWLADGNSDRIYRVWAECSESAVCIPPVFARLNGRFGENHCAAEVPVLRARANAASAIAASAQDRFVRDLWVHA